MAKYVAVASFWVALAAGVLGAVDGAPARVTAAVALAGLASLVVSGALAWRDYRRGG